MRPGLSTIQAAEHSIDFDAGPDGMMVARINQHAGHKWRPDGALPNHVYRQLLPMLTPVTRAIDPCGFRAGEENAGIDWVYAQRPDCRQRVLRSDLLPLRPAILADEQAGISSGENRVRLCRMGDQRLDSTVEWERCAMTKP